jgi:positive phototaxis protein PixI
MTSAIQLANGTNSTTAKSDREQRFLGFAIQADVNALLPLADLQGAMEIQLTDILPVPQMSAHLLGIVNWRGKSTWIVDLAKFMGQEYYLDRHPQARKATILMVQAGNNTIGWIVDRTISVTNHDLMKALPLDDGTFPQRMQPHLSGYFLDEQRTPWAVLDLPHIFGSMNLN